MSYTASIRIPGAAETPAHARVWCLHHLRTAAAEQASLVVDDAAVVVSELITNALRAGCAESTLTLTIDERQIIRLAVSDDAPGLPHLLHPSPEAEHGRGLLLGGARGQPLLGSGCAAPDDHGSI